MNSLSVNKRILFDRSVSKHGEVKKNKMFRLGGNSERAIFARWGD